MFGVNSDNFEKDYRCKRMKSDKITGSRYSNGNAPNVNWNSNYRKLNISWNYPDNAYPNLRAREKFLKRRNPILLGFL